MDLSNLTSKELEELLAKKRQEEREAGIRKREAYEGIKAEMICGMKHKVSTVCIEVQGLHKFCQDELGAFRDVMLEYGQLKRGNAQMSFTVQDDNFKIEVKSNKVKKFDERADVAASRLIEFLQTWIQRADNGANNPMYQLAMTLLERNKFGDLDYKSISKLYELENKFNDPEYSEIMQLFKESNVVEGTATNYYFEERDERGVWRKLEPSFNRL